MNKKIIGIIITIILIGTIGTIAFFTINNKKSNEGNKNNENNNTVVENKNEDNQEQEDDSKKEEFDNNNKESSSKKTLVVYYSATNNTKNVAEKIAKNMNADIFEIVPSEVYTSEDLDWTDNNSRVTKEHEDESLRNVKLKSTKVDNWDSYETVIIGYPIWWGIAAWPVDTFVKANNFEGKTIIPFCTSASSGLGNSNKLLAEESKGGNWLEGHRFNSNASDSDIKEWADSIK